MGRKPKNHPSFFKILIGDFADQLRIPQAFLGNFEGKVPSAAVIKADEGEKWDVKIKQIGDNSWIFNHDGWKKLVKDCELRFGDLIILRLISKSVFKIVRYAPSGCEKPLVNPAKSIDTKTSVSLTIIEHNEENPVTARTNQSPKSKDSPAYTSRRRSSVASAKEKPLSFQAVIKKYNRYCLTLPKSFARETGIAWKKAVVLRNEKGKVWPVEVRERNHSNERIDLSAGWSTFQVENKIVLGDSCLFNFIQTAANLIHVEVQKGRTVK